jgi:hypothetical protein
MNTSETSALVMRPALAPSAFRTAISRRRWVARTVKSTATLAAAINITSAVAVASAVSKGWICCT